MSSDQGFCKVCNQAIYFDYGVNEWMHTRFVSGSNEYDHGAELATDTNPTPGPQPPALPSPTRSSPPYSTPPTPRYAASLAGW